jgi:diguanylate cyclase (GGDEF)-like protein
MDTKQLRAGLLSLILITLAALLFHRYAMERIVLVDGLSGHAVDVADDKELGGHSQAALRKQGRQLSMDCRIASGYEWPFCEMSLLLRRPPAGIDLSNFTSLRLWVRVSGPEPRQQLRVFLRNYDPAYATPAEQASMKPHEVVFDPSAEAQPVEFRLSQFMVASWWANEHPLSVRLMGPQLDNVATISLTTGGKVQPGRHEIVLDRLELRGNLVSEATFRLAIIVVWLAAIGGYLVYEWISTQRALRLSHSRQASLREANAELSARSRQYADLAHRDPLTGVSNRDGLKHALNLLADGRSEAPDGQLFPLSIVFADLDHFKQINDQHGHDAGDQVIKGFATLLSANVQRRDLVARWGGEEFVLMFPGTGSGQALIATERLRGLMQQHTWPQGLKVTASFGIAEAEHGDATDDCIRRADRAMYMAKRAGRDRVLVDAPAPVVLGGVGDGDRG